VLDYVKKFDLYSKKLEDLIIEDLTISDKKEYKKIKEKNLLTKDVKLSSEKFSHFYGIIGFIKLLQGYYLIVITQMSTLAKLGRKNKKNCKYFHRFLKKKIEHKINKIEDIHYIALFEEYSDKKMHSLEEKYMKCLLKFDLSLEFYFSCSYDLTNPLSKNITKNLRNLENKFRKSVGDKASKEILKSNPDLNFHVTYLENYFDFFAWNQELITEFMNCLVNKRWILPIIHGYIEQKSIIFFTVI